MSRLPPKAIFFALLAAVSCTDWAAKLPRFDHIPAFQMTDTDHRSFSEKDLEGSVWIVDFIYTNCPAECPRMTSRLHQIEDQTKGLPEVKLLSISVDPDRDTPEVLNAFAQRYGAPNKRWRFLTGDKKAVHLLAFETFHIGDVIGKIEHSTKFAILDKHRTVRGYYSSFSPEEMEAMLTDVNALRKERS